MDEINDAYTAKYSIAYEYMITDPKWVNTHVKLYKRRTDLLLLYSKSIVTQNTM